MSCFDVRLALVLQFAEADDDVGDLHAGVVDVVLHVDRIAAEAQQADEGVAENGVAQVADVRGLVGIDASCARRESWPFGDGGGRVSILDQARWRLRRARGAR